jgi:UDP-galactopyranose mutase
MEYDYLIVGAGLFGATFARQMTDAGKKCLVIDKRSHIGGNCYTENMHGINVHMYGPHIFHTSSPEVWKFVNKFAKFNSYKHDNVKAVGSDEKVYSLPFTMHTFSQMFGVHLPEIVRQKIQQECFIGTPHNLEEQALSLVGKSMYQTLIKDYTTKQWGRLPKDLPADIITRLPLRFTYDSNYFYDIYQGIPIGGYTKMIEKMLEGIPVVLNTEYTSVNNVKAKKVVYTGAIDEYFNYEHGRLDYRTMRFEHEILPTDNYQGTSVVNDCRESTPYTRTIEHRWFEQSKSPVTVITREYPEEFDLTKEPYYPVNDEKNTAIYEQYQNMASKLKDVIFGGRLAEYKYMDMHVVIASALNKSKKELANL